MKRFVELCDDLESGAGESYQLYRLVGYFNDASPLDHEWALSLLLGYRPKRMVTTQQLRTFAAEELDLPDWLTVESEKRVGDPVEATALMLDASLRLPSEGDGISLSEMMSKMVSPMTGAEPFRLKEMLADCWKRLCGKECVLFHRLITGRFRSMISERVLVDALAQWLGMEPVIVARRLLGGFQVGSGDFDRLCSKPTVQESEMIPEPWIIPEAASDQQLTELCADIWAIERRWSAERAQIIVGEKDVVIWSADGELWNSRFPEICKQMVGFPKGTVVDGSIRSDRPGAIYVVCDLLRESGTDFGTVSFAERRMRLETLMAALPVRSEGVPQMDLFSTKDERIPKCVELSELISVGRIDKLRDEADRIREKGGRGILLRQMDSTFGADLSVVEIKPRPFSLKTVLLGAELGEGPRSHLYSRLALGVSSRKQLVSLTKVELETDNEELKEMDEWIREHILKRLGPMRTVKAEQVVEIEVDDLELSNRHKTGVIARNPIYGEWLRGAGTEEIDDVEDLRLMAEIKKRATPDSDVALG